MNDGHNGEYVPPPKFSLSQLDGTFILMMNRPMLKNLVNMLDEFELEPSEVALRESMRDKLNGVSRGPRLSVTRI